MKTDAALERLESIILRHRRHVELSPGIGDDAQRYALAVCDEILDDMRALSPALSWEPSCHACGGPIEIGKPVAIYHVECNLNRS